MDEHGGNYKSMVNNMMNFVKEFKKNSSLERLVFIGACSVTRFFTINFFNRKDDSQIYEY